MLNFSLEDFKLKLNPMVIMRRAERLLSGLRKYPFILTRVVPAAGPEVVFSLHQAYSLDLLKDACLVQVQIWTLVGGLKLHKVQFLGFKLQISNLLGLVLLKEDIAECLFVTRHLLAHF